MKYLPTVKPTAGVNTGVSLFFVIPVSQHDIVTSKANLPCCIDRYHTVITVHDFRLQQVCII